MRQGDDNEKDQLMSGKENNKRTNVEDAIMFIKGQSYNPNLRCAEMDYLV